METDPTSRAERLEIARAFAQDGNTVTRHIEHRPRIDFPDADVQLSPAQERAVVKLLVKKGYNEKYRFKRLLEGRPIRDGYSSEERAAYWRDWSAARREERNAKARERYRVRRYTEGAVSFLQKVLTSGPPTLDHSGMKRKASTEKPIEAREAARFLSVRVGVEVSEKALLTWARRGRVPCQQLVGKYYFTLAELVAWLEAGRIETDTARALDEVRRIPRLMA
jgi:hypothetical protein